jgi:hypothetical protein
VAETGGFVVCTNEGNADLGAALAPLHVASMGIEKLLPRAEDLAVFLRLLARSGTGRRAPCTRRTSTARGRGRRCTWCSSTTGGARSSGARGSGGRSSASGAAPA